MICTFREEDGPLWSSLLFVAALLSWAVWSNIGREKTILCKQTPDETFKPTTASSNEADLITRSKLPPEVLAIIDKYPEVFKPFKGLSPSRPTDIKIDTIPEANKNRP
ncbi:hypothetical protein HDU78_009488 [Chytriomyces hyalinus]|nr:hypothetical protein HDU78_009488 [Chytriomyces hyalinus]